HSKPINTLSKPEDPVTLKEGNIAAPVAAEFSNKDSTAVVPTVDTPDGKTNLKSKEKSKENLTPDVAETVTKEVKFTTEIDDGLKVAMPFAITPTAVPIVDKGYRFTSEVDNGVKVS